MDPWPSPVRTICLNFDRGGYESSRYGTLSNISPKHYPNVKKTMTVLSLTRTNINNRQCSGWFLVLSLNEGFHKWSGVPPVLIIFFEDFRWSQPSSCWGTPMTMENPCRCCPSRVSKIRPKRCCKAAPLELVELAGSSSAGDLTGFDAGTSNL